MITFSEAIKVINKNFAQTSVSLDEFNYNSKRFIASPNPKYLYRGENDFYLQTLSNYQRLNGLTQTDYDSLHKYIEDLSLFLLGKYFSIYSSNDPRYQPILYEIGGFLQHYGFPLHWIDLTKNINVAAFFATHKNTSGKGKIGIVETVNLIKMGLQIFKLEQSGARRPSLQEAYAIKVDNKYPDLKNKAHYAITWIDFNVTKIDIQKNYSPQLLSTKNDRLCDDIIKFINSNQTKSPLVNKIITEARNNLISCKSL